MTIFLSGKKKKNEYFVLYERKKKGKKQKQSDFLIIQRTVENFVNAEGNFVHTQFQ